jgi:hypothetical protein
LRDATLSPLYVIVGRSLSAKAHGAQKEIMLIIRESTKNTDTAFPLRFITGLPPIWLKYRAYPRACMGCWREESSLQSAYN